MDKEDTALPEISICKRQQSSTRNPLLGSLILSIVMNEGHPHALGELENQQLTARIKEM